MRISEITDINNSWAILKNIDFDSLIDSFNIVEQVWPRLLETKSRTLIAYHKKSLIEFLDLIESTLLDIDIFPDQTDAELLQFKKKLAEIKNELTLMAVMADYSKDA
jgi:hypothetical protein